MKKRSLLKRIVTLLLSIFLILTMSMVSTNTSFAAEIDLSDNTLAGLQTAIQDAGSNPTTIIISGSFSFEGTAVTIPAAANIKIQSQGGTPHTLTQTRGRHFTVSGNLTLENIILDGSSSSTSTTDSGGVEVLLDGINHGKFTMNSGAVIQNCYTKSGGAGVSVTYGTFTMNDDSIIQNCTADSGGGLLSISSAITINNGSIKGCKATCGGGVYITGSNGTFTMYDGVIGGAGASDGNAAGYGGGIFAVGNNNRFYIGGDATGPVALGNPKVNGNTAYFYGGGISSGGSGTQFTMYSGEINGNKNTESGIYGVGGGGLHIRYGSAFTVLSGSISYNTTVKNGGGIFVNGGGLTLNNTCTVVGNTAAINGGGIYGNANETGISSTVTLNNGIIRENTSKYGGGVYLKNSSLVMGAVGGDNNSTVIENNTASYMGGGVDVHDGSVFTMNSGTIRENQSVSGDDLTYGGGVEVYNGSTFIMKDGIITGNSAMDYSGGVEVYQDSTFTMDGGSITNNSAPHGGGVSVGYMSARFNMNGGTIDSNTASFGGGGVYVYSTGSMGVTSGNISSNTSPYGGGIFTVDTGKVDVDNCAITNNTAVTDGGGIYTVDRSYANLTTGSGTIFEGNAAATALVPNGDLNTMYPAIQYAAVTAPFIHPLNNYDINTTFSSPFNCHITFDSQGGSGIPDQVKEFGETVDEPSNPIKTGYAFLGWWIKDENDNLAYEWDFNTELVPEIHGVELVLHAEWEAQFVTVSGMVSGLPDNSGIDIHYTFDGGVTNNTTTTDENGDYRISALYDSTLFLTPSDRTGYGVSPNSRNITVTSEYLMGNDFIYTLGEYTVTFETNGGSPIDNQTVSYGEIISKPVNPTREGHAFAGWYTDNGIFLNAWDFDHNTVTDDLTLYAQWDINEYTVTFNSNGGTAVDSQKVAYGKRAVKPIDITRQDYNLIGWYKDNVTFKNVWDFDSNTITEDTNLYAQWMDKTESATPETGDRNSLALWSILLSTSLTGIGFRLWRKRWRIERK